MRYATPKTWAEYLKIKEGVHMDHQTIQKKLIEGGKIGRMGRHRIGQVFSNFYSEQDVREVCADLLQGLPQADDAGFFQIGEKRYGATGALAEYFRTTKDIIYSTIKSFQIRPIKGRGQGGSIFNFYPIKSFQIFPRADRAGFIESDGIRYGSVGAFMDMFKISRNAIISRIKSANIQSINGRTADGTLTTFYREDQVIGLCNAFSRDYPQADENGFFKRDGKRFGTKLALSKIIPVAYGTIKSRIKASPIQPIQGKNKGGQVCNFYSEADILSICDDLLRSLPQADENGFFEKDGIRFGTITAFARDAGISRFRFVSKIKNISTKPIQGKGKSGQIVGFYSEDDISHIYTELSEELPQADKSGFFTEGNIYHGTINAWSRAIPIPLATLSKRIQKIKASCVVGRVCSGNRVNFYSESDVRSACADLLKKRNPKAA